ncbi:EAL domain-containing protein [Pectobacteriaceae bacterium CE90]|nr:EAL domain-containing protein [Pectobacteriaceae bacterium CE90]
MRIRLEIDYISKYLFSPIYSLASKLYAVEMIGRFHSVSGNLAIPQEILMGMLNWKQKEALLTEQLSIIKSKSDWFKDNQILLLLKIDYGLSEFLSGNEQIRNELQALSFVQLEINETFPNLSQGKESRSISELSASFDLWLDNFGSGQSNLKPLYDGLMHNVKLNPNFVWKLLSRPVSVSMMNPLLHVMKKHCHSLTVVAKGIDNTDYLEKAYSLDINAVQGNLWPAVPLEQLENQLLPSVCYG